MLGIALAIQGDGISAIEILRGIPHDGPAIMIYIMILGFAAFIWHGGRKKSS